MPPMPIKWMVSSEPLSFFRSSSNINSFSLLNFDIINRRYNIYTFPLQEEFLYVNDTKGTLGGIYKYVKTEKQPKTILVTFLNEAVGIYLFSVISFWLTE
jgi:hypothetical protein